MEVSVPETVAVSDGVAEAVRLPVAVVLSEAETLAVDVTEAVCAGGRHREGAWDEVGFNSTRSRCCDSGGGWHRVVRRHRCHNSANPSHVLAGRRPIACAGREPWTSGRALLAQVACPLTAVTEPEAVPVVLPETLCKRNSKVRKQEGQSSLMSDKRRGEPWRPRRAGRGMMRRRPALTVVPLLLSEPLAVTDCDAVCKSKWQHRHGGSARRTLTAKLQRRSATHVQRRPERAAYARGTHH